MNSNISPFRNHKSSRANALILVCLLFLQSLILGISVVTAPWLKASFGLEIRSIIFAGQLNAIAYIVVMPLYFRLRLYFRRFHLLTFALTTEISLSLCILFIHNYLLMLLMLFLLGISKAICTLDFISLTGSGIPWLKHRPIFYGVLYMVIKSGGQFSDLLMGIMVHKNSSAIILLSTLAASTSLILTVSFFHRGKIQKKISLKSIAWHSMAQLYVSCACLCYICTFGKTDGWFSSYRIWLALILMACFVCYFIYSQYRAKTPLWDLRVFNRHRQVALGTTFLFILYFFFTSSGLTWRFVFYNMGSQPFLLLSLLTATTYLIIFPMTGLALSRGINRQWVVCCGFIIYAVSYFVYYTALFTRDKLALLGLTGFLQGTAFAILLTTLSTFMSTNISDEHRRDRLLASLISRYVIGAAIFSAFFSAVYPIDNSPLGWAAVLKSLLPSLAGLALIAGVSVLFIKLFQIRDQSTANKSF